MENYFLFAVIPSVISTAALMVLIWQLSLLRKQTYDNYERSRKEKTIELLVKWTDFISEPGGTAPASFVQVLTTEQTEALANSREFLIHDKLKVYVETWLENVGISEKLDQADDGQYIVSRRVSTLIRRRVVAYLNNLEVIMEAKRHMIADSSILNEQFRNYVNVEKNKDMLGNFRKAVAGIGTFPGIEAFVRSVINDQI